MEIVTQPRAAFGNAEKAWFWTMRCLLSRQDGAPARISQGGPECDPDTVVKVIDRLYRDGKIGLHHARILRLYGERGNAPNPGLAAERGDFRIWREAMDRMEHPLAVKGIIPWRNRE